MLWVKTEVLIFLPGVLAQLKDPKMFWLVLLLSGLALTAWFSMRFSVIQLLGKYSSRGSI